MRRKGRFMPEKEPLAKYIEMKDRKVRTISSNTW